jgi:catechol 2,3-dioxygenase-like lactoylglutathione lyase family enzyme
MAVSATRIRSFAPQFLVDDLERAIKFYREVLGFSFGPTWRGFYAIGERDGFEVHLKCAPKAVEDRANRRQHRHLDVYASVIGVDALYAACKAKGVTILKPLDRRHGERTIFILKTRRATLLPLESRYRSDLLTPDPSQLGRVIDHRHRYGQFHNSSDDVQVQRSPSNMKALE